MNIDIAKYKLIRFITEIQSEFLIRRLLAFVNYYRNKPNTEEEPEKDTEDLLAVAYEPVPDFIPVETLAKEQGYSNERLKAAYAGIDHSLFADEDMDELLAAIK